MTKIWKEEFLLTKIGKILKQERLKNNLTLQAGVSIDIQTQKFESSGIIIITAASVSVYEKRICKTWWRIQKNDC